MQEIANLARIITREKLSYLTIYRKMKSMSHVSKKLLEQKKFFDIHKELFKAIAELSRSGRTSVALGELFTKTEKLMLAKRLAIICMLDRKESIYAIERALKVSPSTVARISLGCEKGAYSHLISEIRGQNSFWVQLEKIIPPRVGRNRFKNFLQF